LILTSCIIFIRYLLTYSIRGLPFKLFENYFADRAHFVSIEDIQSQKASIMCGVPQG